VVQKIWDQVPGDGGDDPRYQDRQVCVPLKEYPLHKTFRFLDIRGSLLLFPDLTLRVSLNLVRGVLEGFGVREHYRGRGMIIARAAAEELRRFPKRLCRALVLVGISGDSVAR
jgi:hypothetical protein